MSVRAAFLLVFALLSAGSCAAQRGPAPAALWDDVIRPGLFADVAEFSRTIEQEGGTRIYVLSAAAGGEPVLSVVVSVTPAGGQLDPDAWRAARDHADDTNRRQPFPRIGSRAQAQAPSFSPEGAFSGLLFTTSDERYDVLVSVFEASSSAPRGELTATDAARRLERAYRNARQ